MKLLGKKKSNMNNNKKKTNKIGNLFFEVKRDWIWEKNNKKITLKNDRYLDVQNIN